MMRCNLKFIILVLSRNAHHRLPVAGCDQHHTLFNREIFTKRDLSLNEAIFLWRISHERCQIIQRKMTKHFEMNGGCDGAIWADEMTKHFFVIEVREND